MTHFNEIANSWDTEEKKFQYNLYANKIKSILNKNQFNSVLEIGCGTGLLGSNFIDDKNIFLGIDTSEGMLEVFNQKFKEFKNVKSANLNLEDKDLDHINQKFDLIITSMAFHHLISPEKMLLKLKYYLSKNGTIAIIDLDEENGTFHPDPKNMGVHYFGFSKNLTDNWAKNLNFRSYKREIINTINKESGNFPIFLAIFCN